jgi:leader peptidase (prepilin peptidase)/N-methyltransferase
MSGWLLASAMAAAVGFVVSPTIVSHGLATLGRSGQPAALTRVSSAATGAIAGITAVAATHVAGSWWWLPGLSVWAVTLSAVAICDAQTQRIPTPVLQTGGGTALVLIATAGLATEDWRALAVTLIATLAAGAILTACWRFAGAGFGDVRLAIVGGLGLGHTTSRALALAGAVFVAVTISHAGWTFLRTRDRYSTFAYGPALAATFLIAAAA